MNPYLRHPQQIRWVHRQALSRTDVCHISLVFREMWDATDLRLGRTQQWYPTSREKPARCGAPVFTNEKFAAMLFC